MPRMGPLFQAGLYILEGGGPRGLRRGTIVEASRTRWRLTPDSLPGRQTGSLPDPGVSDGDGPPTPSSCRLRTDGTSSATSRTGRSPRSMPPRVDSCRRSADWPLPSRSPPGSRRSSWTRCPGERCCCPRTSWPTMTPAFARRCANSLLGSSWVALLTKGPSSWRRWLSGFVRAAR